MSTGRPAGAGQDYKRPTLSCVQRFFKGGGGVLGRKIREKLEEGGSEKLTASRIGMPSFSYSHHWEFVIMYVCFGFLKESCKRTAQPFGCFVFICVLTDPETKLFTIYDSHRFQDIQSCLLLPEHVANCL